MMHKAVLLALLFGAVLGMRGVVASPAAAQQAITIVSEQPRNEFPTGVTFTISFNAAAGVKEARLRYQVAPDGTGASGVADCTSVAAISCSFTLTSGRGIVIIPGAEVTYHWELADNAGNQLSTPDQKYVHQDTRFTFKTLQRDNITLYYHAGGDTAAQVVLDAAAETIDRVSQLEKTQVTFPVKVFLYTTADEMQPAIAPGGPGRGVQVLGEVVYSDTAMVSADVATLDITRHEVAHIVTRQATKGPFDVPAWLNEGISVFSQSHPLEGHDSALKSAIKSDRVLSMRELSSSASGSVGATVGLYYGEAGSIVKYLVDTYGPDKFAALLKTFKDGSDVGKAFQSVYGFDQYGLENEWRTSVGLEPRAIVTIAPTATSEARTAAPAATSASSPDSGGSSNAAIAIIVGLIVLVIVAAGAALVLVRRRM
jgi:peptidase MA superfamily protein